MIDWYSVPDYSGAKWDSLLAGQLGATVYQLHGWGELKRSLGWGVIRVALGLRSAPLAMAQVLFRKYPFGVYVCWIPGGPTGDVASWAPGLGKALQRALSARWLFLRVNTMLPTSTVGENTLNTSGWHTPTIRFSSGLSLTYNPSVIESERLLMTSTNWRHNLKRSGKHDLVIRRWASPDAAELQAIYRSMEQHKSLEAFMTNDELEALLDRLRDKILLYRCEDRNGDLIALRACAILGTEAWDLLAAASPAARKQYASHATLWALLNECGHRGITRYDMGGVDPIRNKGVFDFKRGIGAQPLTYLGEWEWTSTPWIKFVANIALRRRKLAL